MNGSIELYNDEERAKTIKECPICYETLNTCTNFIVTECGHKFHASCILKNVSVNGLNCPCCRYQMVEEEKTVVEEEKEDETIPPIITDETYTNRIRAYEIERIREQMEIHDDAYDDDNSQENGVISEETQHESEVHTSEAPSIWYVTKDLEARGVTMLHMVAAALSCYPAYYTSKGSLDFYHILVTNCINQTIYDYTVEPSVNGD